ncbi:MAG TPA: serpin family protein [Acidobacteriota bacterium]|nr:serpin family protein [Acidobacteriota bacterium]
MIRQGRILVLSLLAVGLLAVLGITQEAAVGENVFAEAVPVAEGNNSFACDLYGILRNAEGNLFFSPLSIRTALAMAYGGVRGETAAQIAEALNFDPNQDKFHPAMSAFIKELDDSGSKGKYELFIANALWGQKDYKFLGKFLALMRNDYGAPLKKVDFISETEQARQAINAWVKNRTKEKIRNLIKRNVLSDVTRLVITNAIYFKGNWEAQFDKKDTKDLSFELSSGDLINTPFMSQRGEFRYLENDRFQALEMPYAGGRLAMVFFLPKRVEGLGRFERSISAAKLKLWLNNMNLSEIDVYLPKFKFSSGFDLVDALKSLGMIDAFGLMADFTGMVERPDLFISAVVHKAFVEVNEEGTEAGGATGVVIEFKAAPNAFRADHPFLFLIRDLETGAILFMGRVTNPQE